MEIIIKGDAKEIADLVLKLKDQNHQEYSVSVFGTTIPSDTQDSA